MLREAWNPQTPDTASTVELMNRCFGGGWDERLHHWYLARPFGDRMPDRIVIFRDDLPVAGSVVNYRQLQIGNGEIFDVGIASGSWTLPGERGQGHFTRMMERSAARAGAGGCRSFLAFVTEDNASANALARAGAEMIPAAYLVSDPTSATGATAPCLPVRPIDGDPDTLFASIDEAREVIRFHYGSPASWSAQFLQRPDPVEVLNIDGVHFAVVEKTADTDRLQWVSCGARMRGPVASSLASRAALNGRKFFMYGTGDWTAACAADAGLAIRPGYIACLPTDAAGPATCDGPADGRWDVQSGDRL